MRTLQALCFLLSVACSPLAAQDRIAIKGGRVIPVAGAPIDNGVVLIRNGVIEAVGKGLPIPTDARVLDAAGKVVVPGLIEAHSSRGMDQVNETNPNVPFLSVVDSIDPGQEYFEECRRQGITTVAIVPGNNTMFGGQAAVVRTAGTYVSDMLVKRSAGLKISLRPTGERNRMGHLAAIRKELDDARAGSSGSAKPETRPAAGGDGVDGAAVDATPLQQRRPPGAGRPTQTTGQSSDAALVREALGKLLKGDLPAFVYCELAMDVPQALKLVKDYKLQAVLVLGQDCHKAVAQVAAAKLPVILDSTLVYWENDPRTGEEKQVILPKIYREAGVPVMYQVTGIAAGTLFRAPNLPPTVGTNYLWYQAATAVKYGTPPEDALAALTLRSAQTLGLGKTHGSLEPGKVADLAILTGDPLKLETWVETTLVGGKVVYERAKDRKLKALLTPEK